MDLSKDPAFLFYSSDFLIGVSGMTMEERGQYITLMCLQHQKGHLSEKTICLSLGLSSDSDISSDVISKFKMDEDGNYFNSRLDREIGARQKFIESRANNGSKGGRPRKAKTEKKPSKNHMDTTSFASAKASKNLLEDEDEDVNTNDIEDEISDNSSPRVRAEDAVEAQQFEPVPFKKIMMLYNSTCTRLRKIRSIDGERKRAVSARFKKYGLEAFQTLFEMANASNFLCGTNQRNWAADFDWLMKATNMAKVLEGKYDNGEQSQNSNAGRSAMDDLEELHRLFDEE